MNRYLCAGLQARLERVGVDWTSSSEALVLSNLSYGPEEIIESYYNFPIPIERGLYGALDLQVINDPGYNRDRGAVLVPGLRLHLEF